MKLLLVFAAVLACSAGADVDYNAPIVKAFYENNPESFQYNYETGNGIVAQAEGLVKNANSEYPSLEVKGAYSYKDPEGQTVQLSYVADENGYQPQGAHLPVAPPVPEAIVRSLAYIAAHPAKETAAVGIAGAKGVASFLSG